MSTTTANGIIPSASTSEGAPSQTAWWRSDLNKPSLSVPELGYYSLFVHAIIFHFLFEAWSSVVLGGQISDFFQGISADDRLVLILIWRIAFLGVTSFICFQFFRAYGRIVANEDELLRLSPELRDDSLKEKWYFRRIVPIFDYLFRGATLLLLLKIERLAALRQNPLDSMSSFLGYWGDQVIWVYLVLGGYTALINFPKFLYLQRGSCRNQAIGFALTDVVALISWSILWRLIPWFGMRDSRFIQSILAFFCLFLLWVCYFLERKFPLIEPVLKYLKSHSLIKSALLLVLFIVFVGVVVDVSCPSQVEPG